MIHNILQFPKDNPTMILQGKERRNSKIKFTKNNIRLVLPREENPTAIN